MQIRKSVLAFFALGMMVCVLSARAADASKSVAEESKAHIHELIRKTEQAFHDRDLATSQAMYERAEEAFLVYDIAVPLQDRGTKRAWEKAKGFFDFTIGPVTADWVDPVVEVATSDDIAYVTSLLTFSFTTKEGKKVDLRGRSTLIFKRLDGRWTCVHEHDSVPYDIRW